MGALFFPLKYEKILLAYAEFHRQLPEVRSHARKHHT